MRIGLVADAHGNAEGLARCLALLQAQGAERIISLGDAIGYFPHGAAVCALLRKAGALCLMGNHEAMALGLLPVPPEHADVYRLEQSLRHVPRHWLDAVRRQGPRCLVEFDGMRLLCVHGAPHAPLTGRQTPEDIYREEGCDAVAVGHTHRPWIAHAEGQLWVNPGSCGYPRDHGTLLSCAVLDTRTRAARVWRLPFQFRPGLLNRAHAAVQACTERVCATPHGVLWEQ